MKVGIYGDSFACLRSIRNTKLNNDTPWMEVLKSLGNYKITNFGLSGSSVYWSYKNYKENYKKFDKNIFITTSPDRIYVPHGASRQHWNISSVEEAIRNNKTDIADLNEIRGYFEKIYNSDEHQTYKELMMQDASNDVTTLVIDNTKELLSITSREVSHYQTLNLAHVQYYNDNRCCHMSQAANNYFASRISAWLEGGTFNINDWEISCALPDLKKVNSYFVNNL